MIAPRDSTAPIMLRALAHTSNALDAAIALDIDRSNADRDFFQVEKATLDTHFTQVEQAHRAVMLHGFREQQKVQARVVLGDAVLDRGVRKGKKRLVLETSIEYADRIFGSDISEIVDAERQVEPKLVLECVDRLVAGDDFAGKAALVADLTDRARRQMANFTDRDQASRVDASLDAALEDAIIKASDALYSLEKRMLDRFTRDKVYVRAFFFNVSAKRKKRAVEEPPASQEPPATTEPPVTGPPIEAS